MTISEIMKNFYETAEMTPEEANELFKENKLTPRIETRWNRMTADKKAETVRNMRSGKLSGWALVDVQVGGYECVEFKDGKVVSPIGFETIAYVAGDKYVVEDGEKLVPAK